MGRAVPRVRTLNAVLDESRIDGTLGTPPTTLIPYSPQKSQTRGPEQKTDKSEGGE